MAAGLIWVSAAAAATDLTWTGTGSSPLWSNSLNWNAAPGSPAVFGVLSFPYLGSNCAYPATDTCYLAEDDLGAVVANKLTIDDDQAYGLVPADASDTLTLLGDGGSPNVGLTAMPTEGGYNVPLIQVPVTLGADQTWEIGGNSQYPGEGPAVSSISGNHTLALDFSNGGTLAVTTLATGAVTASGYGNLVPSTVAGSDATLPAAGLTLGDGASLVVLSPGTVSGPLTATGSSMGNTVDLGDEYAVGTLAVTGDVSLNSHTTLGFFFGQPRATASDYPPLTATGNVNLGGATLTLGQAEPAGGCSGGGGGGGPVSLVSATGSITGDLNYVDTNGVVETLTPGSTGSAEIPILPCGSTVAATLAYGAHTVTATIVDPRTPVEQTPPAISGTPMVGVALNASSGTWSGSPWAYLYSWYSCSPSSVSCTNQVATGSASYTPTASDVGNVISVCVRPQNGYGNPSACSDPTAVVAPAVVTGNPPVNTAPPAIAGTPQVNTALDASAGSWSNSPTSYSYTWYSCSAAAGASCSNQVGIDSSTYTPTASDLGNTLHVCVSAANADGSSTSPSCSLDTAPVSAAATTSTVTTTTSTVTTESPSPPTTTPTTPDPASPAPTPDPGRSTPAPAPASALPSPQAIHAALGAVAHPSGSKPIKALIKSGVFTTQFVAPGAGSLGIAWTASVTTGKGKHKKHRTVTVATGSGHPSASGALRVTVRLTGPGRALLKLKSHGVAITATEKFRPAGGNLTTVTKHFSL